MSREPKIVVGAQFGDLTVVAPTGIRGKTCKNHRKWECLCSCGSVSLFWGSNLLSGRSRRCDRCRQAWVVFSEKRRVPGHGGRLIPRELGLPYQRHDRNCRAGDAYRL